MYEWLQIAKPEKNKLASSDENEWKPTLMEVAYPGLSFKACNELINCYSNLINNIFI